VRTEEMAARGRVDRPGTGIGISTTRIHIDASASRELGTAQPSHNRRWTQHMRLQAEWGTRWADASMAGLVARLIILTLLEIRRGLEHAR
jgi:hypothetical protein